jgi:hypothetical protein
MYGMLNKYRYSDIPAPDDRFGQDCTEQPQSCAELYFTHLACNKGKSMPQIATKDTSKYNSSRNDVLASRRDLHARCGYLNETDQSCQIRLTEHFLNHITVWTQSRMRPSCSTALMARSGYTRPAAPAAVALKIQVETQRIKRSRDIYVTRPIEARGNKSAS